MSLPVTASTNRPRDAAKLDDLELEKRREKAFVPAKEMDAPILAALKPHLSAERYS